MVKNFLGAILGVVAVVLLLGLATEFSQFAVAAREYVPAGSEGKFEGDEFVNRVVPTIISSWDSEELKRNASPELLKSFSQKQWDEMAGYMKKNLGQPVRYLGALRGETNGSGKKMSAAATYYAMASFGSSKEAVITLDVSKNNGAWKISAFDMHVLKE